MAEHGTSNKKNETNSQYLFLMDAWTIFFLRRWVRTQTDRKWISACRFSVRYFCQTELTSWFTKRVRMGLFFKKIVDSTLLPFAMFMFKMLNWIIITCDSPFSFQIKSNISLWSFMDFSNCKWPVKFGQYSFHNFQLIFYQEKFFYKWPAVFKSIRIFPKKKTKCYKKGTWHSICPKATSSHPFTIFNIYVVRISLFCTKKKNFANLLNSIF